MALNFTIHQTVKSPCNFMIQKEFELNVLALQNKRSEKNWN